MSEAHARVLAQHRGLWLIEGPRLVPARGRLALTPVTGDYVEVDAGGAIARVLPRSGTVCRRAAGRKPREQVLAANVDLALVVEPLPAYKPRRAERLAALAEAGGVPWELVLTKADLGGEAAGLTVSAVSGQLGALWDLLRPGTTTVLLGASGAGKSTLVNALLGEERLPTREIRACDGRGRHTTTTRTLLELPTGAFLIDTPGLREVAVSKV